MNASDFGRNRRLHVACWPASLSKFVSRRLSGRPCLRNLCGERLRSHLTLISDLHAHSPECTHTHTNTLHIHHQKTITMQGKDHEEPVSLSQNLSLHFSPLASTGALFSKKTNRCYFRMFFKIIFLSMHVVCVWGCVYTHEHAGAYMLHCAWGQRTTLSASPCPPPETPCVHHILSFTH